MLGPIPYSPFFEHPTAYNPPLEAVPAPNSAGGDNGMLLLLHLDTHFHRDPKAIQMCS